MITAGIRELKAKLSSYIDTVNEGEQVVITEHGREVAIIIPISKERRAIRALVDEGMAHWAGGKPKGLGRDKNQRQAIVGDHPGRARMILYLGTSSLVKLYVDEKYSDIVRGWVEQAEIVATCRVAYTEMISALELRVKQNDLSKNDYDLIIKKFSHDWLNFAIVDFDEREAGGLVKKYGLTRFAAIHLSAAKIIKKGTSRYLTFILLS